MNSNPTFVSRLVKLLAVQPTRKNRPLLSAEPRDPATHVYRMLSVVRDGLAQVVLLIFRLAWGLELIQSGRGHLQNVDQMVVRFTNWGVPFPHVNVYISAGTEIVGGVLLMLGLATRLISIPLFFNFVVAYLTASRDAVANFFSNPNGIIDDTAFPFLVTTLVMLAFGPGVISLDAIIRWIAAKRVGRKSAG